MSQGQEILIVDDLASNRELLQKTLESSGYEIIAVPSGEICLQIVQEAPPDLILLDVVMPLGMDGFETCRRLKAEPVAQDIPVIFITAKDDERSVEKGFEVGASDYITIPFLDGEVRARVATHLKQRLLIDQLQKQNLEYQAEIERRQQAEEARNAALDALHHSDERLSYLSFQEKEHWGISGFVGQSQTITDILDRIRLLEGIRKTSVLITGESGTGKELIARAIHFNSPRADQPFIPINCAKFRSELAESELFGHVRGAFTGADKKRDGCFQLAHRGTLFLDEIGEMPLDIQAKFLRVLEDGYITPVGSDKPLQVDVRILAATNADLQQCIQAKTFREDLYHRLARFPVTAPPLRQRREDIPLLARHFLDLFAKEMGRKHPQLTPEALDRLQAYPFPGNVRELKNIIEAAIIESHYGPIRPEHLHFTKRSTERDRLATSGRPTFESIEAPRREPTDEERILAYVSRNGWINNKACCDLLDIDRHRAYYLLDGLKNDGALVTKGLRRAAKYYLPDIDQF